MVSTFYQVFIDNKGCYVVVSQPSVVFHIETVIWFEPQIMRALYMERYTKLKWVKIEY